MKILNKKIRHVEFFRYEVEINLDGVVRVCIFESYDDDLEQDEIEEHIRKPDTIIVSKDDLI